MTTTTNPSATALAAAWVSAKSKPARAKLLAHAEAKAATSSRVRWARLAAAKKPAPAKKPAAAKKADPQDATAVLAQAAAILAGNPKALAAFLALAKKG